MRGGDRPEGPRHGSMGPGPHPRPGDGIRRGGDLAGQRAEGHIQSQRVETCDRNACVQGNMSGTKGALTCFAGGAVATAPACRCRRRGSLAAASGTGAGPAPRGAGTRGAGPASPAAAPCPSAPGAPSPGAASADLRGARHAALRLLAAVAVLPQRTLGCRGAGGWRLPRPASAARAEPGEPWATARGCPQAPLHTHAQGSPHARPTAAARLPAGCTAPGGGPLILGSKSSGPEPQPGPPIA